MGTDGAEGLGPTQLDGAETLVHPAHPEHEASTRLVESRAPGHEGLLGNAAGLHGGETGREGLPEAATNEGSAAPSEEMATGELRGDANDGDRLLDQQEERQEEGRDAVEEIMEDSEQDMNARDNDNNVGQEDCDGVLAEAESMEIPRPSGEEQENETDPYYVPPAWRRVLRAWNEDMAVGAGLEDSALSVGNFQHGHNAVENTSTASGTSLAATTESSGSVSGSGSQANTGSAGSGQTTLTGWLRK